MAPVTPSRASSTRSGSISTINSAMATANSALSIPSITSSSLTCSSSAFQLKPPSISIDDGSNSSPSLGNQAHRLELGKLLDSALTKFQNLKKNTSSTHKANILRLHLLPSLRYPVSPFQNVLELMAMSLIDLNPALIKYEAHLLINWLSELLNLLFNDYASIAAADRNCYYESVSRILSHNIWHVINAVQNASEFTDIIPRYSSLSLKFFEFSILRINGKSLPLSASILAGKVFAYAFINIPNISRGLSFLLNTKLNNYKTIHKACISNCNSFPLIINDLADQFPNHLWPLLTSSLHPRTVNYTIESYFINAVLPPQQKIKGIKETKGVWVNRWASLDNVSLFASFYRHYLSLCAIQMRKLPLLMIDEYYIYGMPGFLTLLTHIYEVFKLQIRSQIMKAVSNFNNRKNSTPNTHQDELISSTATKPLLETPIDKLLAVLRDFLANPRHPFEKLLRDGVIRGFEHILKIITSTTSLLDTFAVDSVLALFVKFCKALKSSKVGDGDNDEHNDSKSILAIIDWKYWLDVLLKLLKSDNVTCQARAISTLYILWDFIPDIDSDNDVYNEGKFKWITDLSNSVKVNFICHLISKDIWEQMLGHYMPLIRCLYAKLIVWKILGVSSIAYSLKHELDIFGNHYTENSSNFLKIKPFLTERLAATHAITDGIVFTPTDPVLHQKFVITKASPSTEETLSRERKLRVYPWEVFDDAVYTSSTPTMPNTGKFPKSNPKLSLPSINKSSNELSESSKSSWVGKLFKKSEKSGKTQNTKSPSANHSRNITKFLSLSKTPSSASSSSTNIPSTSVGKSTSNSSISASSKGSPISSLASSFSSLEITQNDYAASNALIGEEADISQPPEWRFYFDIHFEKFEFKLVPDEERIVSFLRKLNGFNNVTGNNNGVNYARNSRFYNEGELLIINDEPRLPNIDLSSLCFNKANRSLESVLEDNDSDSEVDGICFVDADVNVDLNGGFGEVYGFTSFSNGEKEEEYGYSTGTKILDNGQTKDIKECLRTTPALLGYLSNGLLAFNEEVISFEKFLIEQLKEIDNESLMKNDTTTDDIVRGWEHASSSSSLLEFSARKQRDTEIPGKGIDEDQRIRLNIATYEKLKTLIPGILPDITGDKLNAY